MKDNIPKIVVWGIALLIMSMFHFMKTSVAALLNPIKTVTIHSTIPTVRPEALSIIGTHDGSFHCDEALAVSMLLLHPNFKDSSAILRTRNPALLSVSCADTCITPLILLYSDPFKNLIAS